MPSAHPGPRPNAHPTLVVRISQPVLPVLPKPVHAAPRAPGNPRAVVQAPPSTRSFVEAHSMGANKTEAYVNRQLQQAAQNSRRALANMAISHSSESSVRQQHRASFVLSNPVVQRSSAGSSSSAPVKTLYPVPTCSTNAKQKHHLVNAYSRNHIPRDHVVYSIKLYAYQGHGGNHHLEETEANSSIVKTVAPNGTKYETHLHDKGRIFSKYFRLA
jgi:hypothetical protein